MTHVIDGEKCKQAIDELIAIRHRPVYKIKTVMLIIIKCCIFPMLPLLILIDYTMWNILYRNFKTITFKQSIRDNMKIFNSIKGRECQTKL